MLPEEKVFGSVIHIAGYVNDDVGYHPEFHFVRNIHGIEEDTGQYKDIREDFAVGEDFWSRDCPKHNLMEEFERGVSQIYINGFPEGRFAYLALLKPMDSFFSWVWKQRWGFRPPANLSESCEFVKLYMNIIATLFRVSDYDVPLIGGEVQTIEIPLPRGTARTVASVETGVSV
jgi:hypothetical protein